MKPEKRTSRLVRRTGALLALCGCGFPMFSQQQSAPLRRTTLDMVFSSSLFHSANRNDATVAVRVWASMLGRRRGFQVDPTVAVVDDVAEIRKRVVAGPVSLVALDAVEYLKLADLTVLEPAFSALRGERESQQRYLLLAREDSGISSLEALRGRTAIIHANTRANLGQVWLDAALHNAHLDPAARLFRSVGVVQKASGAILPVFFGKADAGVVDQANFDVTKEMNPQVGAKLRVLAASPQLVEGIVCVSKTHVEFRQDLLEGMRDLHFDPEGRQILLVFRFSRLVPFDRTALEHVRELWRKAGTLSSQLNQERDNGSLLGARLARTGGAP